MKIEFLEMLRCPISKEKLLLKNAISRQSEIITGVLYTKNGDFTYNIKDSIPRFVSNENYAENFGFQWNLFAKTQLDSFSKVNISANRFWQATGWNPADLKSQWVLDAGCGAGRFAEIALVAGAKVVALDYSNSVDACLGNLKNHKNLHVIQGDIYNLPFPINSFKYVYSLGVLQHTPNVRDAFFSLSKMVQENGSLCADFYWKRLRTLIHSKYLFRPLTTRLPQEILFKFLEQHISKILKLSQFLGAVPLVGQGLKRVVPVADYTGRLPLDDEQLLQWALLDTFDMLAPKFDRPQTGRTIKRWFDEAGFKDVEVGHWSHLVGRGSKVVT